MTSEARELFRPVKIVEVELSRPLDDFRGLERYVALKALVRLHGSPLGYVQVGVSGGCCRAEELSREIEKWHVASILRHLAVDGLANPQQVTGLTVEQLVGTRHPAYAGTLPTVTVVVCTRNRVEDLAVCLDSIVKLDYPALDLLVIDNAPSDDSTERRVRSAYPGVRYVQEPRPGLSWARNRALLEARGEIIAFTDDDVVVDPGWARAFGELFAEDPAVMAATGLVAPFELETEAQALFEFHGGFGRGFERRWHKVEARTSKFHVGAGRLGTGANMAFRRRMFDEIGSFDVALGVGTVTNGGEDLEMFFRALERGHTLVYEPNALTFHRHRRDYPSFRHQVASGGVGLAAFHFRSARAFPGRRLDFLRLHLWWMWKWHVRRFLGSVARPERTRRELIIADLRGYLVGPFRYPRARRIAAEIARKFGPQTATAD